jgi:thymidylate kinase
MRAATSSPTGSRTPPASTRARRGAICAGWSTTSTPRAIGVEPDLTLILDMDPEVALERGLARGSGEDRFEEFGLPFQQKLRAGFLALAARGRRTAAS